MRSFLLVGLFTALFTTGVTASPYIPDDPSNIPSSAIFSFSDTTPTCAFPSGTGVPSSVPTGVQGSGGQIYICYPVDPSDLPAPYPGTPKNVTLPSIPLGPVPTSCSASSVSTSAPSASTSAPSITTSAPPFPTSGQGSGGPIYICHPDDRLAAPAPNPGTSNAPVPADSIPITDASSVSASSTMGVPQSTPTDAPGSGAPVYVCYPADSGPAPVSAPFPDAPDNTTLTLSLSDSAPTLTSSIITPTQY